jgi:hypothetical protein
MVNMKWFGNNDNVNCLILTYSEIYDHCSQGFHNLNEDSLNYEKDFHPG